ncbi:RagB/SusD family nutrient uptake outer membrane protein [Flavobacterium anhuiense]|uniref:RagB/SusD family nutrient uptake outer membrane protein n=1 Tax=Flavobacterium anhuiense TaxID=459526 RepID=UPI000E6CD99B|nr:RagB/SusD family nutrient uptake outer membrane protein [Flavobacterium anhuiense]
MKNIKIALSLLLLVTISSCDDFLSEVPDNRTQIDTPEKISELLVTAYPDRSYFPIAEVMSDNVFDTESLQSVSIINEESYNWEMHTQIGNDSENAFWMASYEAIAAANQALDAIEKLGGKASLNPQKGEALIARAYNHFMLVSLWANRYNPATAATDLGVPYITKPETELLVKYKRNTVKEVFDFIEQDINEGMKYVTNEYKEPKYHFNIDAAKAFACRFYLIKGDWDKVLEYSEGLGSKPTKIRNYTAFNAVAFAQMPIEYSRVEQETNLLVAYPNSIANRSAAYRFALPGNRSDEIFGTQTNMWAKPNLIRANGQYFGGTNVFVPKLYEYFKYTNLTSGVGVPYTATVLFSNDEMYLNRIEALVMKNRIAEANTELGYFLGTRTSGYNATTDILNETVVTAKYPPIADEFTPFYALTDLQKSYIKAIAEARRRDFIREGLRWFDVKRFNLVVTHNTLEYGKVVKNNVLVKDDKRRALQIPLRASDNGIEKNPR